MTDHHIKMCHQISTKIRLVDLVGPGSLNHYLIATFISLHHCPIKQRNYRINFLTVSLDQGWKITVCFRSSVANLSESVRWLANIPLVLERNMVHKWSLITWFCTVAHSYVTSRSGHVGALISHGWRMRCVNRELNPFGARLVQIRAIIESIQCDHQSDQAICETWAEGHG